MRRTTAGGDENAQPKLVHCYKVGSNPRRPLLTPHPHLIRVPSKLYITPLFMDAFATFAALFTRSDSEDVTVPVNPDDGGGSGTPPVYCVIA